MLNDVSLLVNSCFKARIRRGFYMALWPATKDGSTMIIPSAENHREYPDMPHGAKVMLYISWDQLGVVYYELLKPTKTITGYRYRTQLMRLSRTFKMKRLQYQERHDKVILQHDNAGPHVARPVKTSLETLEKKSVQNHCDFEWYKNFFRHMILKL